MASRWDADGFPLVFMSQGYVSRGAALQVGRGVSNLICGHTGHEKNLCAQHNHWSGAVGCGSAAKYSSGERLPSGPGDRSRLPHRRATPVPTGGRETGRLPAERPRPAGQQVEVTGKLEVNIPPKEKQTASSYSRPEHRLTVASISKVADTCSGASE